jgi:preprotein translocase subunit SecE
MKEPKSGKTARSAARALPSSGTRPAVQTRGRGLSGLVPRFLMDIISELRKVVWPTREDTFHLALVVVIVTIIFGAILGAIDIGFGWLIDRTLLN